MKLYTHQGFLIFCQWYIG